MKLHTFTPASGKTSCIRIGESIENSKEYVPRETTVVITDKKVRKLYGHLFPEAPVIEIGMGEGNKNLETMQYVYERLMEEKADRSAYILGIGGGIVCDIAGFAASTYMRGVRFGFAATTLLAQVDASVGGKNGVNVGGFKNMAGTINQPEFVICDPAVLKTLNHDDVLCGMAEIVKHGAILDDQLFEYIEKEYDKALNFEAVAVERMVYDSVIIKSMVVEKDEREKGERKKLNYGHTFGHALEKELGIPHGKAVGLGMVAAAHLSVKLGFLTNNAYDRIVRLLELLGLPVRIGADPEKLMRIMEKDKKKTGKSIQFVLLGNIGEAFIHPLALNETASRAMISDAFEHIIS